MKPTWYDRNLSVKTVSIDAPYSVFTEVFTLRITFFDEKMRLVSFLRKYLDAVRSRNLARLFICFLTLFFNEKSCRNVIPNTQKRAVV